MAANGAAQYKCTLSEATLKKAKKELNENPKTRSKDIQALRERAEKYPGLHSRLDDAFLLRFLRTKKFDCDKAFECLLNHYTTRQEDQELFKDLTPSKVKHVFEAGVQAPQKLHDDKGRKIIIFRMGRWDPEKYPIEDLLRSNICALDKLVEDEVTQVGGVMMVVDASEVGWNHAKNFSPSLARRIARNIQEAMPVRMKGIHYIFEPSLIGYIWAILRPFLKEKLANRVFFHGSDLSSLHQHVKPEFLPEEYGGKLPPVDTTEWKDTILGSEQTYIDNAKFCYEPPQAEYNPQTGDAMAVLTGTYKKLSVD